MSTVTKIFNWPFRNANSDIVAGWGFWATLLGFGLTLLGLYIAYRQLTKTRGAADAAGEELRRIQHSLARFEIGNEAVRAAAALNTARNYARNNLWVHAADSYEVVHDSLLSLKESDEIFDEALINKMDLACVYIKRFCDRVDADRLTNKQTINPAKTISVMSDQRTMIAEISRMIAKDVVK